MSIDISSGSAGASRALDTSSLSNGLSVRLSRRSSDLSSSSVAGTSAAEEYAASDGLSTALVLAPPLIGAAMQGCSRASRPSSVKGEAGELRNVFMMNKRYVNVVDSKKVDNHRDEGGL